MTNSLLFRAEDRQCVASGPTDPAHRRRHLGKVAGEHPDEVGRLRQAVGESKLAKKASLDGLVCSPYEVNAVKKIFKKEIITPGVQIGKRNYDQKRSMEAKKVRSDWLVIGRAITSGNIKKNIQNLTKQLR